MSCSFVRNTSQLTLSLLAGALVACAPAQAVEFNYNGFATIGIGKTISGVSQQYYDIQCPCFIANYPEVGIYENKWSIKPDTKVGVQGTLKVTDQLSFTGQTAFQGANNGKPAIDWAYATYEFNDVWSIQAGRKRLPLFAYSDFFDVGFAYPWIRPAGDLYSWQIVAYNGANVMYRKNIHNVGVTANVWIGNETDDKNRELTKLYYGAPVDERWRKIMGGYLDLNFDSVSMRGVVMTNKVDRWVTTGGMRAVDKAGVSQNFYGLSANVDWKNIVVRSELNRFERNSTQDFYTIGLISAGYRFGDILPMVSYSKFKENFVSDPTQNEIHDTTSLSMRYDIKPGTALKLQYDIFKDHSAFQFVGDSKTISMSLDQTF